MTTITTLEPRRGWSQRNTRIAIGLLALLGFFGILAWIVGRADTRAIVGDFATLGSAIGFVIALHVAAVACDGTAWRALLHDPPRVSLLDFIWARWVREATNRLLPVAQVGGEVAGARVLALRGLPAELAGGSVVLDKLAEALSQIPFTVLGLALMLALRGETKISASVTLALVVAVGAIAAAILVRRAGWLGGLERRMVLALDDGRRPLFRQIGRFAQAVRGLYSRQRLLAASAWHFLGWIIGAGEVWLALAFMGHPVSLASAIALESLGQAITSLGFIVPGALGVQEGAYIAIGSALGLPPETALAVSLVKRVRQIALGVPALCTWQGLELRHWLAAAVGGRPAVAPKAPSSHSNSYVRQAVREILRPFAKTALTPNAITWLRIATGVGACAACAVGAPDWGRWAALLWLISAFLDRGDGEFARLTQRCTERGRLLDYWGDVSINALIFFAIGIGLRHAALGQWSILIGAIAAVAIAIAGILAEALELRIGQKTVPSRSGFDFDDILFVLVPVLWFGWLMPLLIGAFVGGIAAAVCIWYRLSRLSPGSERLDDLSPARDLPQLPAAHRLP